MIVRDVRDHIEAARKLIDEGDAAEAQRHLSIAARQLDPSMMLTTTQAAELLGIRSKNTIKAMTRRGQIAAAIAGNRYMIPMTEIIRLQDEPVIHDLHAIQRDYARMAFPGSDDPVSDKEMESMREGHTGTLPWQR
ncbi:MAG: helix-turn-helix domain-containing protein [Thermomicrobiales bacterium]